MAGERESQPERDQQRERADDQRVALGAGPGADEALVGRGALAVGAIDVGADGGGDAVGGLVDRARDEPGGADAVAAPDERVELGVLALEALDRGVDRGHRARVVGAGAQRVQACLEDLDVAVLVGAQGAVGEHHLRLGEVGVGERRVGVLGGDDPRHDARRDALVGALERGDVDQVHRDDRGGQREDGAEAEAELDRQAHVPESGHAAGGRKTHAP